MKEIQGPTAKWFEVEGKRYIYTTYGISSYYPTDNRSVPEKTRITELLNKTIEDLYISTYFIKFEGSSFFESYDKQPLLVWRRKVETTTDKENKKVYVKARFLIVHPEEVDKVEEYLKGLKE